MKSYPSISKDIRTDIFIYAFDKLDGSNIRAEWTAKNGFKKFGSRTQIIDTSSPFGVAIDLIKSKYEKDLSDISKENRWQEAVFFFELFGPSSFAGTHNFQEKLDVVLFDVNVFKHGLISASNFIKIFDSIETAKCLYNGKVNNEFVQQVKNSSLAGMTCEGVVCKGMSNNHPVSFKIKSQAWLDKLKVYCNNDLKLFEKLC